MYCDTTDTVYCFFPHPTPAVQIYKQLMEPPQKTLPIHLTPQLYHISPPIQPTHSYHRPFRAGLFVADNTINTTYAEPPEDADKLKEMKPKCSPASSL
jgi:hypothetical protein